MVGLNIAVGAAGRVMVLVLALAGGAVVAGLPQSAEAFTSQAMSMNQAASRVQQRFGGELISIQPAEQDGEAGWQARVLLDNGKVKTVFVVARTGAVVDRKRG